MPRRPRTTVEGAPPSAPFLSDIGSSPAVEVVDGTRPPKRRWCWPTAAAVRSDGVVGKWWRLRRALDTPRFIRHPYVLGGYRMKLTAWQCFRSCFMVHNETANIWTHFLGAVFFVLLAFQVGCGSAPAPARTPPLEQVMSAPMGSADWSSTWQLAFPKQAFANVPDSEEEWDGSGSDGRAPSRLQELRDWAFSKDEWDWMRRQVDGIGSTGPVGYLRATRSQWGTATAAGFMQGMRLQSVDIFDGVHNGGEEIYEGISALVKETGARFRVASAAISDRALPRTCANPNATWSKCIPVVESLEAAISNARTELQHLTDSLQQSIICGRSQCFNVTAVGGNDARIFALIDRAHAAAHSAFDEAVSKKALQVGFARAAAELAALPEQLTARAERVNAQVNAQLSATAEEARAAANQVNARLSATAEEARAAGQRLSLSISLMLGNVTLLGDGGRRGSNMHHRMQHLHQARNGVWWDKFRDALRGLPDRVGQEMLGIDVASTQYGGAVWPLVLYLCSAVVCLSMSTLYHCFGLAMSERMMAIFSRLDFTGIAALIYGSIFAVIYYSLFCQPWLQSCYLTLVSLIALPKIAACTTQTYMQEEYRNVRVVSFVAFGFCGIVPLAHAIVLAAPGDEAEQVRRLAWQVIYMGFAYMVGVAIYVSHFPDVYRPGSFDICCSSHQLWHVCILIAAYMLYKGLREHMLYRIASTCPMHAL